MTFLSDSLLVRRGAELGMRPVMASNTNVITCTEATRAVTSREAGPLARIACRDRVQPQPEHDHEQDIE